MLEPNRHQSFYISFNGIGRNGARFLCAVNEKEILTPQPVAGDCYTGSGCRSLPRAVVHRDGLLRISAERIGIREDRNSYSTSSSALASLHRSSWSRVGSQS